MTFSNNFILEIRFVNCPFISMSNNILTILKEFTLGIECAPTL